MSPLIDVHTHIFASLAEWPRQWPQWFGEAAADKSKAAAGLGVAEEALRGIYGSLTQWLPGGGLTAAKLAQLRRKTHGPLQLLAELAINAASAPQIMLGGTVTDLDAAMRTAGVGAAVVIASKPLARNDWLLQALAQYHATTHRTAQRAGAGADADADADAGADADADAAPPRFIPVAHLPDPPPLASNAPEAATLDAWRAAFECLMRAGFSGFKIHPNMDGLPPEHAAYQALFEVARTHGCFVILHTGCFTAAGYKHQQPAHAAAFLPLFERFPDVRVCLAHMQRDEPQEAWEIMRRCDQVYADTSWQPADVIARAARQVGSERILLGSDWPLLHPGMQSEAAQALQVCGLSDADRERIGSLNARRFLGAAYDVPQRETTRGRGGRGNAARQGRPQT